MNAIKDKKKYKTVTSSPFYFLTPSLDFCAISMCILLLPQFFMLFLTKSYNSLLLILICTLAALIGSLIDYFLNHKTQHIAVSVLQGLCCGMFLPATFPVINAFFVVLFVFLIYIYGFKAFNKSFVAPCVISIVICYLCVPVSFGEVFLTKTTLASFAPLDALLSQGDFKIFSFDAPITDFFNKNIFRFLGVDVPEGYISLFWDTGSLIPAFRFNFLTLVSSVVIFCLDIQSPLMPAVFLSVYLALVKTIGPLFFGQPIFCADIIFALFTGGTLFISLYLLSWYATTPFYTQSKVLYAVLAGIVAFFVAGCGANPIGMVFSILIMNIVSCIIQSRENVIALNRLKAKVSSISKTEAL